MTFRHINTDSMSQTYAIVAVEAVVGTVLFVFCLVVLVLYCSNHRRKARARQDILRERETALAAMEEARSVYTVKTVSLPAPQAPLEAPESC